jgi:hypothetical protein
MGKKRRAPLDIPVGRDAPEMVEPLLPGMGSPSVHSSTVGWLSQIKSAKLALKSLSAKRIESESAQVLCVSENEEKCTSTHEEPSVKSQLLDEPLCYTDHDIDEDIADRHPYTVLVEAHKIATEEGIEAAIFGLTKHIEAQEKDDCKVFVFDIEQHHATDFTSLIPDEMCEVTVFVSKEYANNHLIQQHVEAHQHGKMLLITGDTDSDMIKNRGGVCCGAGEGWEMYTFPV